MAPSLKVGGGVMLLGVGALCNSGEFPHLKHAPSRQMQCTNNRVYYTNYDVLVMSGGGIRTAILLGALQYIDESVGIESIQTYVGTSAGAISSLFLIIGMRPIDILGVLVRMNIKNMCDEHGHLNSITRIASNFFTKYGLFSTDNMKLTIEKILETHKVRADITLKELYDAYKKDLVVVSYNVGDKQCEYMSRRTHPDLKCVDAVCMSSCIPLIFVPFEHADSKYIDGGIYDNFAINWAADQFPGKNTLGMQMKTMIHTATNIFEYFYQLADIIISRGGQRNVVNAYKNHPYVDIICIQNDKIESPLNGIGDIVHCTNLFIHGYNLIQKHKNKLD